MDTAFKFDHTQPTFTQACGIPIERDQPLLDLQNKVLGGLGEKYTFSELVEGILKEVDSYQEAVVLTFLLAQRVTIKQIHHRIVHE